MRAPQVCPQKPENEVFGQNDPFKKNSKLCFESVHDDTDPRFMFKFHKSRPPTGSGGNDGDKKFANAFFGEILRQLGRGRQTFAGGVPRDPMTHCKISPQLVPICRSNFVRLQYMSGVGRPATFTDAYNRQEV